jgi:hypothetical protein
MTIVQKTARLTRTIAQRNTRFVPSTIRMQSTNEYGQGKSHASGESKVPGKVQEAAPRGLEEALPDKVHIFPQFRQQFFSFSTGR